MKDVELYMLEILDRRKIMSFKKLNNLNQKTIQQMLRETSEALTDLKANRVIEGEIVMQWLENWGSNAETANFTTFLPKISTDNRLKD